MPFRKRWAVWVGLAGAMFSAGCHSAGRDNAAKVPAFGMDYVPRQSEPTLETDGQSPQQAKAESVDVDQEPGDAGPRPGNLLTRLLPGRDKEPAPRKALPVTARTSASSDDDEDF